MSKISELSDGGAIQSGDTLIAVRSGGNVKVTYGGTTTANIDGGTIDGTVIGGSSAAAGSFTTISASGEIAANGGVAFGDNDKAIFGAGSDLQIYHDGSNSYIKDAGTGGIIIDSYANFTLGGSIGGSLENYLTATGNGAVTLYYDNSAKLATTSTGIDVTGTVTADGLTVDAGTSTEINLPHNGFNYIDFSGAGAALIIRRTGDLPATRWSSNGDINLGYEDTGTTAKFFWDASAESLGIGTSSPISKLHVDDATNISMDANASGQLTLGGLGYSFGIALDGSNANIYTNSATRGIAFGINESEVARIDSSGNLLVGKTSAAYGTAGSILYPTGDAAFTRSGQTVGYFNRLTSDGEIVNLSKDGTTVGSIGSYAGAEIFITGGTSTTSGVVIGDNLFVPCSANGGTEDGLTDLGSSGRRWQDVYATNALIQTSDANEKQDIEALSEAEQRVAVAAKGLLRKFRWKSAVEEKSEDARIHFGIIAQDLQAAFEAEGLDAGRYGMFINSTWTDEETGEERSRMGVRYSELLAFIIAAI